MAQFDCKKIQKELALLEKKADEADGMLSDLEKSLGITRSSRVKSALKKLRKAIGAARKVGNKAALPTDICVGVGEAFEETRKAFENETKQLEKQCMKLSDGRRELCRSKVWKSSLPRAVKKVFDLGEDGFIRKSFFKSLREIFSANFREAEKKIA